MYEKVVINTLFAACKNAFFLFTDIYLDTLFCFFILKEMATMKRDGRLDIIIFTYYYIMLVCTCWHGAKILHYEFISIYTPLPRYRRAAIALQCCSARGAV